MNQPPDNVGAESEKQPRPFGAQSAFTEPTKCVDSASTQLEDLARSIQACPDSIFENPQTTTAPFSQSGTTYVHCRSDELEQTYRFSDDSVISLSHSSHLTTINTSCLQNATIHPDDHVFIIGLGLGHGCGNAGFGTILPNQFSTQPDGTTRISAQLVWLHSSPLHVCTDFEEFVGIFALPAENMKGCIDLQIHPL